MILSYIDIFQLFVVFILIAIPIVMIAKNYKLDAEAQGGGH